jgi:hypothetical protein
VPEPPDDRVADIVVISWIKYEVNATADTADPVVRILGALVTVPGGGCHADREHCHKYERDKFAVSQNGHQITAHKKLLHRSNRSRLSESVRLVFSEVKCQFI